ncbi:unnamed protein product [Meganyctiphanes norvegica]|uniref:Uncharacterized protein n=1 Tax=Meganyctiphanes norvegica TaxID=48144 RepID=A0AAV2R940_MEGNR
MAVSAFWPPLTVLSMFVVIVAFLIIKYGDRICRARSVPFNDEASSGVGEHRDDISSIESGYGYGEGESVRELVEHRQSDINEDIMMEMQYEKTEHLDKYEHAV